ncbi:MULTISPECIES: MFS transporter small subunit [Citricoccus]|uniref:MFS transporter small subunit n=1 Tax=Citricoccus TaxID=169133 RepID=UPI000255F3FD|nr:hypothetical protein [Citricoccus sp. CH26A]
MSTPNAGSSTAGGTAPATREPAGTGGAYRTTALVLALIVIAALAYGLVQTALKASALFTG